MSFGRLGFGGGGGMSSAIGGISITDYGAVADYAYFRAGTDNTAALVAARDKSLSLGSPTNGYRPIIVPPGYRQGFKFDTAIDLGPVPILCYSPLMYSDESGVALTYSGDYANVRIWVENVHHLNSPITQTNWADEDYIGFMMCGQGNSVEIVRIAHFPTNFHFGALLGYASNRQTLSNNIFMNQVRNGLNCVRLSSILAGNFFTNANNFYGGYANSADVGGTERYAVRVVGDGSLNGNVFHGFQFDGAESSVLVRADTGSITMRDVRSEGVTLQYRLGGDASLDLTFSDVVGGTQAGVSTTTGLVIVTYPDGKKINHDLKIGPLADVAYESGSGKARLLAPLDIYNAATNGFVSELAAGSWTQGGGYLETRGGSIGVGVIVEVAQYDTMSVHYNLGPAPGRAFVVTLDAEYAAVDGSGYLQAAGISYDSNGEWWAGADVDQVVRFSVADNAVKKLFIGRIYGTSAAQIYGFRITGLNLTRPIKLTPLNTRTEMIATAAPVTPEVRSYPIGFRIYNAAPATSSPQGWVNSIDDGRASNVSWVPDTAYSLDEYVYNGANVYIVTTAGTSAGSGGPTGTGTGIADNTVVWAYVAPRANWIPMPNL